ASAESLHLQLATPSDDAEIVELVGTLNGLLERLAESAAAKGRFYAAASHELRTPLQALSGHLELAVSKPRTEREYQQIVGEALQQTRRLIALSQDLLTLHRLETATYTPPSESIDVSDVCCLSLSAMAPLAEKRNLILHSKVAEHMPILAQPGHVEMVV